MIKKPFRDDKNLYSKNGTIINNYRDSDGNKLFAVIAKCGYSGAGYFIPIMFAVYAKDINAAIDTTRTFARVSSHKKDAIVDAFEISAMEANFIEAVNAVDPYLNGHAVEDDIITQNRKIPYQPKTEYELKYHRDLEPTIPHDIKTADQFYPDNVLERYLAPIKQGDKYIYPKTINNKNIST